MRRLALVALILAGCDVGAVEPGGGGGGGGNNPDAATGGGGNVDAATGGGAASLAITATTTTAGGTYAPKNVVAVWVEDSGGAFVKTIQRWANVRKGNLVAWTQKAGAADADAVSGATRADHATPLSITWDLRNKIGNVVPDGTYTIRMELADTNTTTTTPNHEGTFTFVKGTAPQNQTALTNNGFTNVSINFTP
jgi:hypothetical protein